MKRVVLGAFLFLAVAACSPPKPTAPAEDAAKGNETDSIRPPTKSTSDMENVTIGDAEQSIYIEATVPSSERSDTIVVEEVKGGRDRIAYTNVTVSPPYPDSLTAGWVVRASRNFENQPVVIRARIMCAGKQVGTIQVGTIQGILGADARKTPPPPVRLDLMALRDLDEPFLLLTVEGELFVMPAGTDAAPLDPRTAVSDVRSQAISASPLRVTFEPGESAPAAPPSSGDETASEPASDAPAPAQ